MGYLQPVVSKLERAHELIQTLDLEIARYKELGSSRIELIERDDNCWDLCLILETGIPSRFGVLVGDVVHNLRSSLDISLNLHLEKAYTDKFNALDRGKRQKIHFPVFDNETAFLSRNWDANLGDEVLVSDLRAVQPFSNLKYASNPLEEKDMLESNPLRELTQLWNTDKHRGVHLVVMGLSHLALGLMESEDATWEILDQPPWVNGSVPFRIRMTSKNELSTLNLSSEFEIGLAEDIKPLNVYPIVNKLRALAGYTEHCQFVLHRWYFHRFQQVS